MPFIPLLLILGSGAFIGSIANNASEPSPVYTTPQDSIGGISPLTIAVYGATALALFWAYKKVVK